MKSTSLRIYYMFALVALIVFNTAAPCFAQESKPTRAASIFIDERGEEYIRIPREGQTDELVRVSEADERQIMAAFNNFDYKSIPAQSIKQFGPEYIKFSSALMVVQMSMCFGTNSSLASLSFVSSSATPTCVDDFLAHLVDWKGWVGFYFFMLGNRYTSTSLMQIATISLAHVGKPKSIPELRKKLAPFFGYLGMAGGSLASQVVHHFLSAPSWGQCISLLKEEGLGSLPCKEAFTHFLSVEDFWDDFAAGTMSMIMGSAAATVTHKVLGSSAHLLKNLPALSSRGVRLVGGHSKAIDLVARVGTKAIKVVRVGKSIAVSTGVPGVMVFVVTELGQFVLFLAWDEVFRNPVARAYYDWDTKSGVQNALLQMRDAAKENQKKQWKTPYVVTTKEGCQRGYNQKTKRVEAINCKEITVDPLVKSILDLHYGASRFRKKVLLNPVEMETMNWTNKMMMAIQKYKFSKSFVETLSKEREKQAGNTMSLAETGYYILVLWKSSLENELPQHPYIPKHTKPSLNKLAQALGTTYSDTTLVKTDISPSRTNFLNEEVLESMKNLAVKNEAEIKSAIIALKKYSEDELPGHNPMNRVECNYLPTLCVARDTTLAVNLNLPFEAPSVSTNAELFVSLSHIFGEELANDLAYQMLCGNNKSLSFKNLKSNGRKADMSLPKLIVQERSDFNYNCNDLSALRDKYDFVASDVLRPWLLNGRIYKNAFDLLSSKNVNWTVGSTKTQIDSWWMTTAFKPFSQFLFEMAKTYQQNLQEHLNTQMDNITPEQLVHKSAPRMRGPFLDHNVVGMTGTFERPTLSTSLMGQVHFVLDTLKYYGPGVADAHKIDQLKMAFAQYILGVKVEPRLSTMEDVWSSYKNATTDADVQSVINAQNDFDHNIKEAVLSKEKMERTLALRQEIMRLKDEIFNTLSYRPYDDLTGMEKAALRMRALSDIEDKQDYVSLEEKDQKLFATFIMLNETLNNITMEIDKLYDKLGAKPFTGM